MKKFLSLLFSISLFCISSVNATGAKVVIEDSAITAAVKAKIAASPIVSALAVQVETNKGIVALQGSVKAASEADTAVEIAASVKGVLDVDTSNLRVQGSERPLTDSYITAKVKGVYIREKIFGQEDVSLSGIHVETNNGVVYLKGEATKEQAENAEKLARLVKGVKDVKSDLHSK